MRLPVSIVPVLCSAISACSGSVGRTPAVPTPSPALPAPTVPFKLPKTDVPVAPWLDLRKPVANVLDFPAVVSVSENASIARTKVGWFAFFRGRGVFGPLGVSADTAWMGLLKGDRILRANNAGSLFVSDFPKSESGLSFKKIANLPGATTWDSAANVVIAGTSWDQILTSNDGGKTFVKSAIGENYAIKSVFARFDGAFLARALPTLAPDAEPVTFVGTHRGSIRKSTIQPPNVYKKGSWLWVDADCPQVLSRGKPRWTKTQRVFGIADNWREAFRPAFSTSRQTKDDDSATPTRPPPPIFRKRGDCRDAPPTKAQTKLQPRSKRTPIVRPKPVPRCTGFDCIRNTVGPVTFYGANGLVLFTGGRLLAHRESGATETAPTKCEQTRVLNGPGISLLLCDTVTATKIFTSDGTTSLTQEDVVFPPELFAKWQSTAARDGTLGVYACAPDCELFVRAPTKPGTPNSWSHADSATAFQILAGGRWLSIKENKDNVVDLAVHTSESSAVIAKSLSLPSGSSAITLKDNFIVVAAGSALEPKYYVVTTKSSLVPAPPK